MRIEDQQLEQEVIGMVLTFPEKFTDISWLEERDFTSSIHVRIWETIVSVAKGGAEPDLVLVSAELAGIVDSGYMAQLMHDTTGLSFQLPRHAAKLRSITERRNLTNVCMEVATLAGDEQDAKKVLDQAEASIMAIRSGGRVDSWGTVRDILKTYMVHLQALVERKGEITGCETGFEKLDHATAGLQDGDLIILAGRPSTGKTILAGNFCEKAAKEGRNVVLFSMEMAKEQIVARHLSSLGKVNGQRLRNGTLEDTDWPRLTRASEQMFNLPYVIDDTPALTVMELRAKARRHIKNGEKSLIVVDYLQLMRGTGKARHEDVSEISRGLKALARELNCPVVALSQLNRSLENRPEKRPIMADLRESGAIEQDADVIMFVYRESVYCECKGFKACGKNHKRTAELIIAKQRNGPLATIDLEFYGEHYLFKDAEDREKK